MKNVFSVKSAMMLMLMALVSFSGAGALAGDQARSDEIWQMLEDSDWVLDGDSEAETVVYTFTDPNCPYCDRLRDEADAWIEAGEVQLRHIMVGILREDSALLSATMLGREDSSAALAEHQAGELEVHRETAAGARKRVMANNDLMSQIGARATPTSLYLDESGQIGAAQGLPHPGTMEEMMGGAKPD